MNRLSLIAALCGVLYAADASAAGFQNLSQSATANAMGSVGAANPDEPNASFYNPANMAFGDSFQIYLGNTNILPFSSFTNTNGERTETLPAFFPPPNFHVGVPILDGLHLGVGVTFPYGLGIAWPEDWEGRFDLVSQNLQTINTNPNVAFRIPDLDLSVALGAQIYYATVTLNQVFGLRDDVEVGAQLGGDGLGLGVTAALMYKPTRDLTIGLNYRSGTTIDFAGSVHFDGEEGTAFESTFVDQDISTSLSIPNAFTLGVGYQLDKTFVEVDVNYTAWSSYDRLDLEFSRPCPDGASGCEAGGTNPPTTSIITNWRDSFAFRLGLQHELMENLKVRAGAVFDLTPIPDQTLSPSLPGNDRAAFSAGVGYTIAGIRLDLGYQFVNALSREVSQDNTSSLRGTYSTTAHVLGVNVGYGY